MMYPNEKYIKVVENSDSCGQCKKEKPKGQLFCQNCLAKLPEDITHDLSDIEVYTRVAAYADATIYLMNDWE